MLLLLAFCMVVRCDQYVGDNTINSVAPPGAQETGHFDAIKDPLAAASPKTATNTITPRPLLGGIRASEDPQLDSESHNDSWVEQWVGPEGQHVIHPDEEDYSISQPPNTAPSPLKI